MYGLIPVPHKGLLRVPLTRWVWVVSIAVVGPGGRALAGLSAGAWTGARRAGSLAVPATRARFDDWSHAMNPTPSALVDRFCLDGRAIELAYEAVRPFPGPLRGGDGNAPASPGPVNRNNKAVRIAGRAAVGVPTEPTADPADWAHGVIDRVSGKTVPASELPARFHGHPPGKPREYPTHQLVGPPGRRVAFDSAFDAAAAAAARLQLEGVELGWSPMPHAEVRALLAASRPRGLSRAVDLPRDRHDGETGAQRALRKEADAMLRRAAKVTR